MPKTMRVLFLAAEAEPFVKVGGLGDVAGSLPRALRSLSSRATGGMKLDIRLAIPMHNAVRTESATLRPVAVFPLRRGGAEINTQIYETRLDSLPVYFISGDPITSSSSVYSATAAMDAEKYTFFSMAALEMLSHLDWQPDVLHANDWHTALAACALLLRRRDGGDFAGTVSLLSLHNLPYMGPDLTGRLAAYGLKPAATDLPDWARALPLPLGLWAADAIAAVSPHYAEEVLTPDFGCGLQDFLRTRGQEGALYGILNGIDPVLYDPSTDEALIVRYDARALRARAQNKTALQELLGLPVDPDVPLLGLVSRFDPQKGIDLAVDALRRMSGGKWQAVLLGTGVPELEEAARALQKSLPGQVRAMLRYDGALARRIYAGADLFLMPSRYEPCGLAQMMAMRYGALPLVSAVGGLADTVRDGETGFVYEGADALALVEALERALALYPDRAAWSRMQKAAMAEDFSWERSAQAYFDLYMQMMLKGPR